VALESTQPLTEMSTRNLPRKGQPARKADNFTAICEPIVKEMWEPRPLTTLWASRPVTGIALFIIWTKISKTFLFTCKPICFDTFCLYYILLDESLRKDLDKCTYSGKLLTRARVSRTCVGKKIFRSWNCEWQYYVLPTSSYLLKNSRFMTIFKTFVWASWYYLISSNFLTSANSTWHSSDFWDNYIILIKILIFSVVK
jgi:hypothetical protein